jgi:hypothetical protein
MVFLATLWLPILLSAVIVFIASSIIHMVLPYHRSDYKRLPDEDRLLSALRSVDLPRGLYTFPYCTHKEMNSPAMQEKRKLGPVGFLTVFPKGNINMGKFLGMWFVYCLVVSVFVAYLGAHTMAPGWPYRGVFRVAGTTAFMAYGIGQIVSGIWGGQPWSNVAKNVFDGLIYALLTAGTFGWLWPR